MSQKTKRMGFPPKQCDTTGNITTLELCHTEKTGDSVTQLAKQRYWNYVTLSPVLSDISHHHYIINLIKCSSHINMCMLLILIQL